MRLRPSHRVAPILARPPHRRGFALIAALWLLVALSALSLEFSLAARSRRLTAINAVDGSRALAAADAGLEQTRARLEVLLRDPNARGRSSASFSTASDLLDPWWHLDHTLTDTIRLGNERVAVTLRDAGSTLNVNLATEEELRRLFSALRMDAGRADRLAQTIADWRDADDQHRGRGAERDEYLREHAAFLPENRPFRELSELAHVLGMSDRDYALVSPYLSVRGSGRVNLRTADRPVLLSLPGIGEEAASLIVQLRRSPSARLTIDEIQLRLSSGARARLLEYLPILTSRTINQTRELELVSEGWVDGSAVRVQVGALLVRADPSVIVVGRRVE